jgi:predicted RNase H-like nuclease (RuvC/YqgF family)
MREGGLSMVDLPIPLDRKLFVGIDPGQTGGLGVVDQEGQFVAAYRWDRREPRRMYQILETLAKDNTGEIHCQADNRLI